MKIKRKHMNRIHNEMRRRFGPYWERKAAEIGQLQRAVVQLQKEVRELNEFKANTLRAEASEGDTGKHVAKHEAEITERPVVWRATFHIFGGDPISTIPARYLYALKNLGIEHVLLGSNRSPSHVRVKLFPTHFPAAIPALEEQLRRLMGQPVKVIWRKVQ